MNDVLYYSDGVKLRESSVKISQIINGTILNFIVNKALIDEGSTLSYIRLDVVKNFIEKSENKIKIKKCQNFNLVDSAGTKIGSSDSFLVGDITIKIYEKYLVKNAKLYINNNINYSAIIGIDILYNIRKYLSDPAYIANINKVPKISYDDVMVILEGKLKYCDLENLDKNIRLIINKNNTYLVPYSRKLIYVKPNNVLTTNISVDILKDLKSYLELDRTEFKKNQTVLSVRNISEKVIIIACDMPIAIQQEKVIKSVQNLENNDINNMDVIINNINNKKYYGQHLLKVSELPENCREFYTIEYTEWENRRKKLILENDLDKELRAKAEESDFPTEKLYSILKRNSDIFVRNSKDVGYCKKYIATLSLKNTEIEPIYILPYKKPYETEQKISEQLKNMEHIFIEKCISSWNSPIMAVPKSEGRIRIVQNFTKLNEQLIMPRFPVPTINNIHQDIARTIQKLRARTKYSTLAINVVDISNAFHCVSLKKEDRDLTAFIHLNDMYRWKRLVQGISVAPSTFSKVIRETMETLDSENSKTENYVDDLVQFSTIENYEAATANLLETLKNDGFTISLSKCKFNEKSVVFCGTVVDAYGIQPLKAKLEALINLPIPTCLKTAQAFAGSYAFYCRVIPKLQLVLSPLNQAIGKGKEFKMNEDCVKACEKLKNLSKEGYAVAHMRYDKILYVCADVSLVGIGCSVGYADEKVKKGEEIELINFHPVCYASRPLDFHETVLSSRARELIGISWALEQFADYLPKYENIHVICDHKSLCTTDHRASFTSNLTRIRKAISIVIDFPNLCILFASNESDIIKVADGLSRNSTYKLNQGLIDFSTGTIKDMTISKVGLNNITENLKIGRMAPLKEDIPKIDLEKVRASQRCDEFCLEIFSKIEKNNNQNISIGRNEFLIKNGLIMRINSKLIIELFIPVSLVFDLVNYLHQVSFHVGKSRLTYFVNENKIYFNNKTRVINQVVDKCLYCQWVNPSKLLKTESYIRPAIKPLTDFTIDLIDYSKMDGDVKYFIIILDKFSLYADGLPLRNKTADEVVKNLAILVQKYNIYGCEILSDNGKEFSNTVFEEYLKKMNIYHTKISPYAPQGNKTERCIKEIKRYIKIIKNNGDDIKFHTLQAINIYNNMPSKVLFNKSPFEVVFGIKPRLALLFPDFEEKINEYQEIDNYENLKKSDVFNWVEYLENHVLKLCSEKATDFEGLVKSDLKKLEIGDFALIWHPQKVGENRVYRCPYSGPWEITERTLNSYKLRNVLTGEVARRNQRLLKKLDLTEKVQKQIDQLKKSLQSDNTIFQNIDNDKIKLIDYNIEEDIASGYNLRKRK